jgi:ABC-type transporter Mla subunit MlaD
VVNTYRKAGFIACFAILLAALGAILILMFDVMRGPHLLKVRFPNVGTLILQEPVAMGGVQVGDVVGIEYTRSPNPDYPENSPDSLIEAALVTLELYKRLKIPKDSRITNFNHSMMGARMILIEVGESSEHMDLNEYQQGYFIEGIAEKMHRAVDLLQLVQRNQEVFNDLRYGTDTTESFQEIYNNTLKPFFNEYAIKIEEMKIAAYKMNRRADQAAALTGKVSNLAQKMGRGIPKMVENTDSLLNDIQVVLNMVGENMQAIESSIELLTKEDNFAHRLIYQRDIFESLKKINQGLNTLILFVKKEGLSDIISFWQNVHILGRNPTKKKSRK